MLIEFFVALRVTKVWLVSLEKMERLERRYVTVKSRNILSTKGGVYLYDMFIYLDL